jgi:cell division protein FtsB
VETLETMLRERQRAFLELVSSTETLRRTVAKLQDQLAEKDAEIARLRLQAVG